MYKRVAVTSYCNHPECDFAVFLTVEHRFSHFFFFFEPLSQDLVEG